MATVEGTKSGVIRRMTTTEARNTQAAIKGLTRLFENMIIHALEERTGPSFEPLMVVDMRFGMFEAFVVSLRADGTVYSIPRPIEVEEADQLSASRVRTPMCAYRKKKSQSWIVCSEKRLQEKASDPEFEVVEYVLDYALTLSETERSTFVRLWYAFLSRLTNTDSRQDYNRVIFIVENKDIVPIIEQSIPLVGEKIDRGAGDKKWQSALIVCIDPKLDLSGFAFLNTPNDLQMSHSLYLLLHDKSSAVEAAFDGSQFSYATAHSITLSKYQKIALVGMAAPDPSPSPNVIYFPDKFIFQKACLIGYLHWWMQIDEKLVEELRQRCMRLEQQLMSKKTETKYLISLLSRLKSVVQRINQQ